MNNFPLFCLSFIAGISFGFAVLKLTDDIRREWKKRRLRHETKIIFSKDPSVRCKTTRYTFAGYPAFEMIVQVKKEFLFWKKWESERETLLAIIHEYPKPMEFSVTITEDGPKMEKPEDSDAIPDIPLTIREKNMVYEYWYPGKFDLRKRVDELLLNYFDEKKKEMLSKKEAEKLIKGLK